MYLDNKKTLFRVDEWIRSISLSAEGIFSSIKTRELKIRKYFAIEGRETENAQIE